MNLLIDIDGTVSENIPPTEYYRYKNAKVKENAVQSINRLYDEGYTITFFTTRKEKDRAVTQEWLTEKGFKYNGLIMNKPPGINYILIDNKDVHGITYKNDWKVMIGEIYHKLKNTYLTYSRL